MHPVQVGPGHEGIRVDGVDGEDGGEGGYEGAEREAVAPPPEDGQDELRQHDCEPRHEGGNVEAKLGQPVLVHVEVHPLQGRGHDDDEQDHQGPGQDPENPLGAAVRGPEEPVRQEERRQGYRRHGDELEETAPGVLGVGQPGGRGDPLGAAEQVPEDA